MISPQPDPAYVREAGGLEVVFCNLSQMESGEAKRLASGLGH